jgi:hypothetical protein
MRWGHGRAPALAGVVPRLWDSAHRQMESAGFVIRQDADTEGITAFSSTDSPWFFECSFKSFLAKFCFGPNSNFEHLSHAVASPCSIITL